MGIFAIVLSLAGLMFFAYRGVNVVVLAPLMALLAVFLSEGGPLLATYTQVFMQGLGNYVVLFFPIFLLGAIFGKVMGDGGASLTIADAITARLGSERAVLAVVLACAILTCGGVSLFVVAFAVYPIAAALFRTAGVSRRLIAAAIALGSFTFTMTALPGTPSIQNAIPTRFFGTTTFAAPGLGLIASVIMFAGGMLWLAYRARRLKTAGEGYGEDPGRPARLEDTTPRPGVALAILPILAVILLNAVFSLLLFPRLDFSYLAEETYGGIDPSTVLGTWSLIAALVIAIALAFATQWRYLEKPKETLNEGAFGSLRPIFNTASEVAYGGVIASLAAFALIRDSVLAIAPDYPTISLAVAVNTLAGLTGSSSGGLSIALETLGSTYLERAEAAGISPDLLHRIATVSSGGLDTLPHSGAVISLLTITALTHRQSYFDIVMVSLVFPVLAGIVINVLGLLFGAF